MRRPKSNARFSFYGTDDMLFIQIKKIIPQSITWYNLYNTISSCGNDKKLCCLELCVSKLAQIVRIFVAKSHRKVRKYIEKNWRNSSHIIRTSDVNEIDFKTIFIPKCKIKILNSDFYFNYKKTCKKYLHAESKEPGSQKFNQVNGIEPTRFCFRP